MRFKEFITQNVYSQEKGNEQIFHGFLENSMVGQVVVFASGSMLANQAFCHMVGYTEEELANKHWRELNHPEDLPSSQLDVEQMLSGEKPSARTVKRYLRKDGTYLWAELYTTVYHEPAEWAPYFLSTIIDISLRVQYETELEEIKKMLLTFLDAFEDEIIIKDEDFRYLLVNQAFANALGKDKKEFPGRTDFDFLNNVVSGHRRQSDKEVLNQNAVLRFEEHIGNEIYESRKFPVPLGKDKVGVGAFIRNITETKAKEKELEEMIIRTKAMYANHDAIIMAIEIDTGRIIEVNPAAERFYGYSLAEFQQMTMHEVNTLARAESVKLRQLAAERKQSKFTSHHRLKSGEVRTVDVYSCPVPYEDRQILFSIIFDVTQREEATKQIHYLAYHDYLTGIYNRRFFDESFHSMARTGEFYPLGVIMGDMNGLKLYNDTFGHAKGDEAIIALVARMKQSMPADAQLARIGGDEFAMILPRTNEQEIRAYLDLLEQRLDSLNLPTEGTDVSISFGYGLQRKPEDGLDSLLKEAEAFMYNRKYYSNRSSRSSAVHVIMETLFTKSEREKYHSERVSQICEAIAKSMKLDKEMVDKIRVAGLLHDIGKIGIEESILNKPGKLDTKEWEIMKLHCAKGAKILGNTLEFHDIADWVLAHHERYDGTGYPNKRQGENIPIAARIIAVADSYDAMTHERPYQKAMTSEEAIVELQNCAGGQLDPTVVQLFLEQVLVSHPLKFL